MITGLFSLQPQRVMGSPSHDRLLSAHKMQPLQGCQFARMGTSGGLQSRLVLLETHWCLSLCKQICMHRPVTTKARLSTCAQASTSIPPKDIWNLLTKLASCCSARVLKTAHGAHVLKQCAPAVGLMVFAMWGLEPLLRIILQNASQTDDCKWKESWTCHLISSYAQPIMLWIGIVMVCRAFDPVVLSTEASRAIKQRFLNFVRSLSTVLAFAYCTSNLTQQLQKVMMDNQDSQNTPSVGARFVGNAVYSAVWIAAVCLFMELLGFSTQKWLTAGGLGTVLLTLAGREIFTNFLSSIMIHATRPFVQNEWIQTKIDGYEVSGTVEHVGWWSPTIVRGDYREAVHIPNHKFTVSVVRNLSQKSHWRIKTHFGISHLDVSKISTIVADMRKVLAKHPQVEQRRLHRRVFLENVDPENQALRVLVSCFVKTSHFEEYLRVKEVILLDLLKVISHHHARLATPIRSVQRIFDDMESRGGPSRDVNRSTEAEERPYLLIEASAMAGQRDLDQPKAAREPPRDGSEAAGTPANESNLQVPGDNKGSGKPKQTQLEGLDSMGLNSKDITLLGAAFAKPPANIPEDQPGGISLPGEKAKFSPEGARAEMVSSKASEQSSQPKHEKVSGHVLDQPKHESMSQPVGKLGLIAEKPTAKVSDRKEKKSSEQTLGKSEKPTVAIHIFGKSEKPIVKALDKPLSSRSGEEKNIVGDTGTFDQASQRNGDVEQRSDTRLSHGHRTSFHGPSSSKQESERININSHKPQHDENLVLGVALDGPKRTLPLINEMPPPDEKELVVSGNGNSSNAAKEWQEGSQATNTYPFEGREK